MNRIIKLVFIVGLFFASSIYSYGQGSTEMLRKAKSMGFSEDMIKDQLKNSSISTDVLGLSGTTKDGKIDTKALLGVDENSRERTRIEALADQQTKHAKLKDSLSRVVFGREIFSAKELTFDPVFNIATPADYRLGPNDEVLIDIWGEAEDNFKQKISPDGTVTLKNVGVISLSGLTVKEAQDKIRAVLSKQFTGISDGSVRVEFSIGQLRTIKVNVVGEVEVPGTYSLPSLATLFNALYLAKGTNEIGTLRDIKLYRAGKEISSLDVYDYLIKGVSTDNYRLQDNDIIMVGPYQNLAIATGKVKRPRIFELKKGESLSDLITFAGGFTGDAYSKNIQVNRKNGSAYQIATVEKANMPGFLMQDGDSINIGQTVNRFDNRVTIKGAVWKEGFYEINRAKTVLGLIKIAEGLKGEAFTKLAHITRTRPDFKREIIAINIDDLYNGSVSDVELKPEDELYIPSIYDIEERNYILVKGEVNKAIDTSKPPKDYLAVYNKFYRGSGAKDKESNPEYIEVINKLYNSQNKTGNPLQQDHLFFDFKKLDSIPNIRRSLSDTISFRENMTIADAILLSGGLKESASLANVTVSRRIKNATSTSFTNNIAKEYIFSIGNDLQLDSAANNFILEPFDEVFVRRSPGYQEQQNVTIAGEVLFPGEYVLSNRATTITDILARSGNLTPEAYPRGAHLKRTLTMDDLTRLQALQRIARDASKNSFADTITSDINSTGTAMPQITVGIDLDKAIADPSSEANILLKDGDVLVVPQKVNTVKINGAVLYPNTVTYKRDANLKGYISQAGGWVERARKRPYIIYMNGQVSATRSGFLCKRYPKVEPGCEIVVPLKSANKQPMSGMEVLSMMNSALSMAAMVTSITK